MTRGESMRNWRIRRGLSQAKLAELSGINVGVREGTIIAAIFVGIIIKPVARLFLNKLKDFLNN